MTKISQRQTEFSEALNFKLPQLPVVIRYYDDFLDKPCSIRNPAENDIWPLSVHGSAGQLDFSFFDSDVRPLLKHWCCSHLQTHAVATTHIRYQGLRRLVPSDMQLILSSSPTTVRSNWQLLISKKDYHQIELVALKSLLYHLCSFNLGDWSPQYSDFLALLALPHRDKYASVRNGDGFLSIEEEAVLVAYFDQLSDIVSRNLGAISDSELKDTAMLVCSFQFGLRPLQIGMLQMRDVRIWTDTDAQIPSVHLTFKMVKQRSKNKALPLPRKVKREWAPIFIELYERAIRSGRNGTDRFFGVSSAQETGAVIAKKTGALLPEPRSATDLRHTAAQRLVDAGASQEELAEFMGHSQLDTGLIYFQTSANQAERVNAALGISAIYQQVAKVAHDRFIDENELAELKGEQQIGAVPHGIPISGIGACSIGQPSCPSNPVMACYGCFKFMPINNPKIHRQVLADFRSVVTFFSESSKGDENSPAFVQLKRSISNVQSIIAELDGND